MTLSAIKNSILKLISNEVLTYDHLILDDDNLNFREKNIFLNILVIHELFYQYSCSNPLQVIGTSLPTSVSKPLCSSLSDLFGSANIPLDKCHLLPLSYQQIPTFLSDHDSHPSTYLSHIADGHDLFEGYHPDFLKVIIEHMCYIGLIYPIGKDYSTASAYIVVPYYLLFSTSLDNHDLLSNTIHSYRDTFNFYAKYNPPVISTVPKEQLFNSLYVFLHYAYMNDIARNKQNYLLIASILDIINDYHQKAKLLTPSVVETYNQYTWS